MHCCITQDVSLTTEGDIKAVSINNLSFTCKGSRQSPYSLLPAEDFLSHVQTPFCGCVTLCGRGLVKQKKCVGV